MDALPTADRLCPTRADGRDVLIAHAIDRATCQERQRGHYHKCFACAFRSATDGAAARARAARLLWLPEREGGAALPDEARRPRPLPAPRVAAAASA